MENYSIPDIIEKVKSGIVHIIHVVDGKRVSSGTGFMVNGYLITNYHVIYESDKNSKIVLKTYNSDKSKPLEGIIELERDENGLFTGNTNKGYKNEEGDFVIDFKPHDEQDYIIFNIPELKEAGLYNFSFNIHDNKRVGEDIFFLGHHLEHSQLTCHTGIISCFYYHQNHKVDIIQLDASVNNSNSGSPLIDPNTSNVIGIITQKESGLSKNFDEMYSLIRRNIDNLTMQTIFFINQQDTRMAQLRLANLTNNDQNFYEQLRQLDDVKNYTDNITSLIREIAKNNANLLEIAKEIKRSANVGIGYAYSVKHLCNKDFMKASSQDGGSVK